MSVLLRKQKLIQLDDGLDWVETYDSLQRNWPYTRNQRRTSLIQAAERMIKRRKHRPLPPRLAFKSTVDYYEALMPLVLAQRRLETTPAWRYMQPLMVRVMLRGWPRDPLF